MRRKTSIGPRPEELKEELMRPSRFLGYDRNSIGMWALHRDMFEVAESQFRRAVYLNPYEYRFKQHLAWALYKLADYIQAERCIVEAIRQNPHDGDNRQILLKIRERLAGGQGSASDDK